MPISASPKRNAKAQPPPRRLRHLGPLLLLLAVGLLAVVVGALPASLVQRLLPTTLRVEDLSGSLWHGSAGRLLVNDHDVGAIEWHIHPWPLLTLELAAEVQWVKIGFVVDAGVTIDRHGATLRNLVGGGPIEDLRDVGIAGGWRGSAQLHFSEIELQFADGAEAGGALRIQSAVGELALSNFSGAQIAGGTDLGGYVLHIASGAIARDADATAELADTGGPLEVRATVHYSGKEGRGLLEGTIRERPAASAALRSQLEPLTSMHARDAQGRIPVELEFTL